MSLSSDQSFATNAAKDTGCARQAIDLLREGGDIAEENVATKITDEYIEIAVDRVQSGRIENKLRDQTVHRQLILEALAELEVDGSTPAKPKQIQRAYGRVAESRRQDPLTTLKSIQNHLADLTILGFSNELNTTRDGQAALTTNLSLLSIPRSSSKREMRSKLNPCDLSWTKNRRNEGWVFA